MTNESLALESAWRLAGTDGEGRDLVLTLDRDELTNAYPGVTVGRHPKLADRVVDDPSLSRRHFRLSRSAEGVTIEDLSSLNGTRLDGAPLLPYDPRPIADGQVISAGRVTLTVSRVA